MWKDAFEDLRALRVLITGASSGIGGELGPAFAACGATVTLHAATNLARVQAQRDAIRASGGNAHALQADLGTPGAGTALAQAAIAAMGGIDVLINNAGGSLSRVAIDGFDAELSQRVMQLNQHSVTETIRAALPHMRAQRRGAIINTTSIAARSGGGFGVALYASAKGAVEALSRSLAREEGPNGIRINCVAPGYIDTPIHDTTSPEQIRRYLDATPLGRAGLAQDCVGVYLLLACERLSGFITGQTIGVNGGMHLM